MNKTFQSIKEGDTILFTKISNSKIFTSAEGSVFKTKVKHSVRTCDMKRASIAFEQPINGKYSITVELDRNTFISYNTKDEVNLNVEVFGLTKKDVLNSTLSVINARITQIESIKKSCDDNIDDLFIAGSILEVEQEKTEELSLEEAASMAL